MQAVLAHGAFCQVQGAGGDGGTRGLSGSWQNERPPALTTRGPGGCLPKPGGGVDLHRVSFKGLDPGNRKAEGPLNVLRQGFEGSSIHGCASGLQRPSAANEGLAWVCGRRLYDTTKTPLALVYMDRQPQTQW